MASRILFISQDSLNISNKVEITAERCCSPNHYQQELKFNHESETENNKRLGV